MIHFVHVYKSGITPAYAGKSSSSCVMPIDSRDHPRLCGEKISHALLMMLDRGSPPPMRGKGKMAIQVNRENRITPAYAGKSADRSPSFQNRRDHPRLCGEKPASASGGSVKRGSPPPMRGKGPPVADMWKRSGITPAYAGKRQTSTALLPITWDHPRLCGEKDGVAAEKTLPWGSPPPMRGKVWDPIVAVYVFRITPAYAGKSLFPLFLRRCPEDHPRLCGEKTKKILKQRYFFHQPASFSFSLQYT